MNAKQIAKLYREPEPGEVRLDEEFFVRAGRGLVKVVVLEMRPVGYVIIREMLRRSEHIYHESMLLVRRRDT